MKKAIFGAAAAAAMLVAGAASAATVSISVVQQCTDTLMAGKYGRVENFESLRPTPGISATFAATSCWTFDNDRWNGHRTDGPDRLAQIVLAMRGRRCTGRQRQPTGHEADVDQTGGRTGSSTATTLSASSWDVNVAAGMFDQFVFIADGRRLTRAHWSSMTVLALTPNSRLAIVTRSEVARQTASGHGRFRRWRVGRR